MNIRHFAFFAAAATLSLAAGAAPNLQPQDDAQQAAPRENRLFRLSPEEAQRMRSTYALDDGRQLVVTNERSRLYAQLDGKSEELVPVARHTFVARDSHTRFTFNEVPFADEVVVEPGAR